MSMKLDFYIHPYLLPFFFGYVQFCNTPKERGPFQRTENGLLIG